METRASHVAVGAFVMVLMGALAVFIAWVAKVELDETRDRYLIHFTGAVSGLQEGSPVRYLGIPVGVVTDLRIDPDDPQRVRVTVEVAEGTPIQTDSVATLELQGLTGGTFVQIAAGSTNAPSLLERDWPRVIPSRPSSLAAVVDVTPRLLENLVTVSNRLVLLLSDENLRAVSGTMSNIQVLSAELTTLTRRLDGAVFTAQSAVGSVGQLAQSLNDAVPSLTVDASATLESVRRATGQIGQQVGPVSQDVRQLLATLRGTADQLGKLVAENREPLRDFTGAGLYEVSGLLNELRQLAGSLSRFTVRLERDPANALIGGTRSGVEPGR